VGTAYPTSSQGPATIYRKLRHSFWRVAHPKLVPPYQTLRPRLPRDDGSSQAIACELCTKSALATRCPGGVKTLARVVQPRILILIERQPQHAGSTLQRNSHPPRHAQPSWMPSSMLVIVLPFLSFTKSPSLPHYPKRASVHIVWPRRTPPSRLGRCHGFHPKITMPLGVWQGSAWTVPIR
jgi:hypothetical protein